MGKPRLCDVCFDRDMRTFANKIILVRKKSDNQLISKIHVCDVHLVRKHEMVMKMGYLTSIEHIMIPPPMLWR